MLNFFKLHSNKSKEFNAIEAPHANGQKHNYDPICFS